MPRLCSDRIEPNSRPGVQVANKSVCVLKSEAVKIGNKFKMKIKKFGAIKIENDAPRKL